MPDELQQLRAQLAQELRDWKDAGSDVGRVVFAIEQLIHHYVNEARRAAPPQSGPDDQPTRYWLRAVGNA